MQPESKGGIAASILRKTMVRNGRERGCAFYDVFESCLSTQSRRPSSVYRDERLCGAHHRTTPDKERSSGGSQCRVLGANSWRSYELSGKRRRQHRKPVLEPARLRRAADRLHRGGAGARWSAARDRSSRERHDAERLVLVEPSCERRPRRELHPPGRNDARFFDPDSQRHAGQYTRHIDIGDPSRDLFRTSDGAECRREPAGPATK